MTLIDALQHLGYKNSRWVSPSGRLVFAAPSASAPARAVEPFRFHGGADPVVLDVSPWWLNDETYIARERAEMAASFPHFTYFEPEGDLPPTWFGSIDTGYGVFKVMILHRADGSLPAVVPVAPKNRARSTTRQKLSPHLFDNGNLCVAREEDWDRGQHTVATVVAWAAHWHACYATWFVTGRWPIEGFGEDS